MTTHRLLAGPPLQAPALNLTKASQRTATFRLAAAHDLGFTMDGQSTQAVGLTELATDVHLVRDGVPLYTGRIGRVADTITAAGHVRNYSTADAKAQLGRRLWRNSETTFTNQEQGSIVAALLAHTQNLPGGSLGIAPAVASTGILATRTTPSGAVIADEITALAGSGTVVAGQPGFDWDITPGWIGRSIQLWAPQRGTDRGVVLDYVAGKNAHGALIETINRTLDPTGFANSVRVGGGSKTITTAFSAVNPGTGQTQVYTNQQTVAATVQLLDSPTIATANQGRWETGVNLPDVTETSELAKEATQQLADLSALAPGYTIGLRVNRWLGPDHIWLGDPVRVRVISGPLSDDRTLRVTELVLNWDDDGNERVQLTLGTPPPNVLEFLSSSANRLAVLERRSR